MQECQPQAAAAKSFFFTQPQVEMANFWHIAMVFFPHLDTLKQSLNCGANVNKTWRQRTPPPPAPQHRTPLLTRRAGSCTDCVVPSTCRSGLRGRHAAGGGTSRGSTWASPLPPAARASWAVTQRGEGPRGGRPARQNSEAAASRRPRDSRLHCKYTHWRDTLQPSCADRPVAPTPHTHAE